MNINNFIDKTIKMFKNSKYNELINFMYENINFILNNFDDFLLHLNNHKLNLLLNSSYKIEKISLSKDPNGSLFNMYSIFQVIILKLVTNISSNNLYEKNEIKEPINNIKYELIIANDELKVKLFLLYLLVFYLESKIRNKLFNIEINDNKTFVGIDYEFNNRIIALMQLNFERLSSNKEETTSHIFIINPGEFKKNDKDILIKYLMTNKSIYKILHGCDSLDLPYMYDILFENNTEYINDFTSTVFDTRFFCEYYKLTIDIDKKCSIYDALLFFEVIDEKKFNELNQTHDYMGPVQDISWNINKMSSYHIKYALYDVLFLKYFLLKLFKMPYKNTPNFFKSYLLIAPITRFIFTEKKDLLKILLQSKLNIDPINNYHIKLNGTNHTLISIYNNIIKDLFIKEWSLVINNILMVNYFRTGLSIIFKNIIYFLIIKKFKVYEKKNMLFINDFNLNHIYNKLDENKHMGLFKIFLTDFQNTCKIKLLNIYK
jgi:hypothetical protein